MELPAVGVVLLTPSARQPPTISPAIPRAAGTRVYEFANILLAFFFPIIFSQLVQRTCYPLTLAVIVTYVSNSQIFKEQQKERQEENGREKNILSFVPP
jgi:hypothetical protein